MRSRFGRLVAVAMVAGVLLLVLLLEGCSASTSPQTSGTSTTATKPFGSLISQNGLGAGGIPLDPQDSGSSAFHESTAAFLDSLLRISPRGEFAPGLAERWEISADGLTHTFYIRKGVKFHNGDDLTGEDVKFSMERVLAPTAMQQDGGFWRSMVASVELKDNYTVVLHLKQPQFELLKGFDMGGGATTVVPKKYIEEKGIETWRRTMVGSGPWKVVSYATSARLELEANEDYWDKTRIPKFKTISAISVPEEATRVAMLKTGELDIATVSTASAPSLKAAGLRVVTNPGALSIGISLWYDLAKPQDYAYGDVRVRKALSLAINRKEIAEQLLAGYAEPAPMWYIRKSASFYDPNVLKPDPYDPEGAKKLLAEAGYSNGFNTRINITGVGGSDVSVSEAVGGYWSKVGVKAQVIARQDITNLHIPRTVPEVWNNAILYPSTGAPGIDGLSMFHSTKSNFKNHNNTKLNELIDKVPLTRDTAERNKLALEAAVLAKNEYSIIGVIYIPYVYAFGSKIGDMTLMPGIDGLGVIYDTLTHGK